MRDVLTIILVIVFLCACGVAGWFSRCTMRGGEQELYNKPLLDSPHVYAILLNAARNNYYRIKDTAFLIAAASFALLLLV
jgi:hypothetical protein